MARRARRAKTAGRTLNRARAASKTRASSAPRASARNSVSARLRKRASATNAKNRVQKRQAQLRAAQKAKRVRP